MINNKSRSPCYPRLVPPRISVATYLISSALARSAPRRFLADKPPAKKNNSNNKPSEDPFRPPQFPGDDLASGDDSKSVAPASEFEDRLRFVQWQQAHLADELEQMRRAQAYDAYTRRRFWVLCMLLLLCLQLFFPLLYYLYAAEMDPDEIPERFLGTWLHEDEPHVYLRITEDGRVTYHRPDQHRAFHGRVRHISPKALQVNVFTRAVYHEFKLEGPPAHAPDGKLSLVVDGVKLTKLTQRRSPEAFLRVVKGESSESSSPPPPPIEHLPSGVSARVAS